jgi:uncharacterized protein (TIGR03086 family)
MATRHGTAEVSLPSDTEILISRTFEAPLELVWDALVTPRHLLRWWGPNWCPLVSCDVDLRVGGSWRYVARDLEGNELAWHGSYREIEARRRIVSTEVFEGFPDAESVNTMTLTWRDGATTLQTLVAHTSREHRDGHVQSGMEAGMQETFKRLEDLLAASGSPAERFRRVAGAFTDRVSAVPAGGWDRPAPCEGWVARDVVVHMVEWMPSFLARAGVDLALDIAPGTAGDEPAKAWEQLAQSLQALLDDPDLASSEIDVAPVGRHELEVAIDRFFTGDILIHTWDLARATGLDETLDGPMVSEMLVGMQPHDDALRQSGHYGPKVEVPDSADDQTKLLAFTGRHP